MNHILLRAASICWGWLLAVQFFFSFVSMTACGAERTVLIEEFSATWCGPCATSGLALEWFLGDYPDDVILLEMHVGDGYDIPWGDPTRMNFYGVDAIPTALFDGGSPHVGALSGLQPTYDWYDEALQSRLDVPTDVTIDISAVQTGTQSFDVTTTIGIEAGGQSKRLQLYLVEALDHWPSSPFA